MKTLKVTITGEITLLDTEDAEAVKKDVEYEVINVLGLSELHIQWENQKE